MTPKTHDKYFDMEIRSKERVRDHGEVFTPKNIVNTMTSMVNEKYWKDPNCLYLEPTCGHGNFLVVILEKRLENNIKARDAINTLFGLDILEDNIFDSRRRLNTVLANFLDRSTVTYKSDKWYDIVIKSGMIIENNVFQVKDSLSYIKNGDFHKKPFAYHDPTGYNQVCSKGEQKALRESVKKKVGLAEKGAKNEFSGYFLF